MLLMEETLVIDERDIDNCGADQLFLKGNVISASYANNALLYAL